MLISEHFNKIPSWITIKGRRVVVIVSGSKPACWYCGETGHLFTVSRAKQTRSQKDEPLTSKKMPTTNNTDRDTEGEDL